MVDPDAYEVPVSNEAEPAPVPVPRRRSDSTRRRGGANLGDPPRAGDAGRSAREEMVAGVVEPPVHTEGERAGGPGVNDGEGVGTRGEEDEAPARDPPEAGPSVTPQERDARAEGSASEEGESGKAPVHTEGGSSGRRGVNEGRDAGASVGTQNVEEELPARGPLDAGPSVAPPRAEGRASEERESVEAPVHTEGERSEWPGVNEGQGTEENVDDREAEEEAWARRFSEAGFSVTPPERDGRAKARVLAEGESTETPVHTEGEGSGGPGVNVGHASEEANGTWGAENESPATNSPDAGPSVATPRAEGRASEEEGSAEAPVHTEGERSGAPGVNDESVGNRGAEHEARARCVAEAGPSVTSQERDGRAEGGVLAEGERAGPSGTERGERNGTAGSGRWRVEMDSDTDLDSEDEALLDDIMKIDWRVKTEPKSGVRWAPGGSAAGSGSAGDAEGSGKQPGTSRVKQECAAASKGPKKREYVDLDPDETAPVKKKPVYVNLDSDDEGTGAAEPTREARRPEGAPTEASLRASRADVKRERASPRMASREASAVGGVKPDVGSSRGSPLTPNSPMQAPSPSTADCRATPTAVRVAVPGRPVCAADAVGAASEPHVVSPRAAADGAAASSEARGRAPGAQSPFPGGSDTPSHSPGSDEHEPGSVSAMEEGLAGKERPGEDAGTAEGSVGKVAEDETAQASAETGPGLGEELGTPASLQRKRVEASPAGRACSPVSEEKGLSEEKGQNAVKKKLFADEETPVAAGGKKRKSDEGGASGSRTAPVGAGTSSEGKRARVELDSPLTAAQAADEGTCSPGPERHGGNDRPTQDSLPGAGSRNAVPTGGQLIGGQPVPGGASLANDFKRNAIAKALQRVRKRGRSGGVPRGVASGTEKDVAETGRKGGKEPRSGTSAEAPQAAGDGSTPRAEVWPDFFTWPENRKGKKQRSGEATGVEAVKRRRSAQEGIPVNGETAPGGPADGVKPGVSESGLPRSTLCSTVGDEGGKGQGPGPGKEDVAESGTNETGPSVGGSDKAGNAANPEALQVVVRPTDELPVAAAPVNFMSMLAGMDRKAIQAMADFFQAFAKCAQ